MKEIASNGGTERALLPAMNSIRPRLALAAAVLLGCLGGAQAAGPAAPRPQPDRWLLIVDTSAAMERRAKAVEGVAGELLVSGMNGQMHDGDELAIWTFNQELYAGVAPMQTWHAARSNVISGRSTGFLARQIYRDDARLEPVMSAVSNVVADSTNLTVVLLSDGARPLAGTPFDAQINAAWAQHQGALKKTRMPLVTVLRARNGTFIGHGVSFAPWPVEFPAFPAPPPVPVAPVAPRPAPAKPIFISGAPKKPEPPRPAEIGHGAEELLKPAPVRETAPLVQAAPVEAAQPLPVTTPAPVPLARPIEPAVIPQTAAPEPMTRPVELAKVDPAVERTMLPAVVAPATPTAATPPASPAKSSLSRKWFLFSGIALMWVAILIALVLARRARRARAASLITRSFDRREK
jgi:hypothetical protein